MKTDSRDRVRSRSEQSEDAITPRKSTRNKARSSQPTTEFGRTLKDLFGKTAIPGQVNEEELFAAAAQQLIKNQLGAQSAQDFKSAFRLNMTDKPNSERYPSAERAAKETIKFFVKATLLTKEEARSIRSLAIEVSQLDDNKEKVWDSWGETRAVTSFRRGQELVQSRLEASGNTPVTSSANTQAKVAKYEGDKPRMEAAGSQGSGGRRRRAKVAQEA
jgi:hypothetical protein